MIQVHSRALARWYAEKLLIITRGWRFFEPGTTLFYHSFFRVKTAAELNLKYKNIDTPEVAMPQPSLKAF